MKKKVLIFIVAYQAEKNISGLLSRIPEEVWQGTFFDAEVLIIDDASTDHTVAKAQAWLQQTGHSATLLSNPNNQRYGGNQKLGYAYAIKHHFDIVILLHGDAQYPPEAIPQLVQPLLDDSASAVFGSRMIHKKNALAGGMPLYKFIGNIVLTAFQNIMLGARLSEYHTGLRAYQVKALQAIPFEKNSNDFIFDNEVIIQLLDNRHVIKEIPIPTFYGDEISHVNSIKYGLQIIKRTIVSRLQRVHLCYDPKFNYSPQQTHYPDKTEFCSSHRYAIDAVAPGTTVIDIGCATGVVAQALKEKGCTVYGYDLHGLPAANAGAFTAFYPLDIDRDPLVLPENISRIDYILLLDVIEHLSHPEQFLSSLHKETLTDQPRIIITTGNIAFLLMRILLLFGQFNYGKRGILDFTHKRLFTFNSLKSLLLSHDYYIEETKGIPLPWPLFVSNKKISTLMEMINRAFISFSKELFSFQIAMIVHPHQNLSAALDASEIYSRKLNDTLRCNSQ